MTPDGNASVGTYSLVAAACCGEFSTDNLIFPINNADESPNAPEANSYLDNDAIIFSTGGANPTEVNIWGNGGGYLQQGQFVDAGNVTNNKLWNTLITAAVRDKSTATVSFGSGTAGELAAIKA